MNRRIKGLLIAMISIVIVAAAAITALASDYTIWDAWWDCSYTTGKAVVRWEKCEKSTKYNVELYRTALGKDQTKNGKQVLKKTVSGSHIDVTKTIYEKGKGTYYFVITPVNSDHPLDDMYVCQDMLDVDTYFFDIIRDNIDNDPEYTTGWVQMPTGWKYLENGKYATNKWLFINNYWYYFDAAGNMLKGWNWIGGRCYYLNPIQGLGGYPEGACWMNGITPDGYTVDKTGAWTINGIVQVR